MKKLKDKTALITGAGRGIGKAAAILFAQNGANLIIVSRTENELEETARQCAQYDVDILVRPIDLSDIQQIDKLFDEIKSRFKSLDILINNAAMFDSGFLADYPVERFQAMLQVNLIAPYYLAQKSLAIMDSQKGGAIVNISSYSGCFGVEKFPGFGAYNISKYGLWGLTEILAIELAERNIRVNQVSPSGVATRMFEQAVPPGIAADLLPEDVAKKILYLAGAESAPMTGQNILMAAP
jgi:NAD(P)-dependent dehydrogenase (short-subunit alcohol dehydrogenase family)